MVVRSLFGLLKSEIAPDILKFIWDVLILEVVSKEGRRWLWSNEADHSLGLALEMMDSSSSSCSSGSSESDSEYSNHS